MRIRIKNQFNTLIECALLLNIIYISLPFFKVMPSFIRVGLKIIPLACCCLALVCINSRRMYYLSSIIVISGALIAYSMANSFKNLEGSSFAEEFVAYFIFNFMLIEGLLTNKTIELNYKKIFNVFLCLIRFTCFTTIFGNFIFPEASRLSMSSDAAGEMLKQYYIYNIGSFGFAYMLVLLIPCICYCVRQGDRKRIFDLVLFFATLLAMKYTTALIIGSLGLGLFVVKNRKQFHFIEIVCLLVVLFGKGILIEVLEFIRIFTSLMENTLIDERIQELKTLLQVGHVQGDAGARLYYNGLSFECFKGHPLIGNLSSECSGKIGGHSYLIDLAGAGGILALICFTIIVLIYLHNRNDGDEVFNLYQELILVQFLILALVNMVKNTEVAFALFVIPFVLYRCYMDRMKI